MKVCIDAGHCKLTPGKRAFDGSFYEWEFNYDVANKIKKILDRHGVNSYVQYIENSNPKTELNARIGAVNRSKPTLLVSIHANAAGSTWNDANGWEIFCSAPGDADAKGTILAKVIEKYSKVLGLKDRGIKDAHGVAGIVVSTTPTAVLIEHGFYTNQTELTKLKSGSFRELCAVADAKGILEFLGITWREESEEVETTTITAKMNGKSTKLTSIVYNGENFVRLRDLADAQKDDKLTVDWNSSTKTVEIASK